jgi:hypothetical protein
VKGALWTAGQWQGYGSAQRGRTALTLPNGDGGTVSPTAPAASILCSPHHCVLPVPRSSSAAPSPPCKPPRTARQRLPRPRHRRCQTEMAAPRAEDRSSVGSVWGRGDLSHGPRWMAEWPQLRLEATAGRLAMRADGEQKGI